MHACLHAYVCLFLFTYVHTYTGSICPLRNNMCCGITCLRQLQGVAVLLWGRLVGWTLLGRRVQGFGLQDMRARSRAVLFAGLGRLCAFEAAMRDPQTSNSKSPGP